jgi:hypothetical protein
MTHNTTNEKAVEAINSNGLHTHTNNANFHTVDAQGKEFATLAAGLAQADHAPHQTEAKNGTVTYWAACWGLVRYQRYLPQIDAARPFLDQIGGRL